jgi:DNA-binding beta-propeller fold protein YncE
LRNHRHDQIALPRRLRIQKRRNVEPFPQEILFKSLGYVPSGIAVDSARNRIYVSDYTDSQIQVINMQTAALEAVIK